MNIPGLSLHRVNVVFADGHEWSYSAIASKRVEAVQSALSEATKDGRQVLRISSGDKSFVNNGSGELILE